MSLMIQYREIGDTPESLGLGVKKDDDGDPIRLTGCMYVQYIQQLSSCAGGPSDLVVSVKHWHDQIYQ